MPLSNVGVANQAIMALGGTKIVDFTDETDLAKAVASGYNTWRDDLLESRDWSFAIKRVALVENTTAPTFGYDHAYDLPASCPRVINTDDQSYPYRIEGDQLLTDADSVKIAYVAGGMDEINPDNWSKKFLDLFVARLKAELAPLTPRADQTAQFWALYSAKLKDTGGKEQVNTPKLEAEDPNEDILSVRG
jgi:hypothetical protein